MWLPEGLGGSRGMHAPISSPCPHLLLTNTQVPMNMQLGDILPAPYLPPFLLLQLSQVEILEPPLGLGCLEKSQGQVPCPFGASVPPVH